MIKQKLAGFVLAAGLLGMTTLSACLKTENTSTRTTWAYSTVINAYPDTVGLNVYDGAKKLDTARFKFRDWTILRDVPGIHNYNFVTYNGTEQIAGLANASFDSLSYHTLIVYGKGKQVVNITEDFANTSADSANIRFFHLADSVPPVNVYLNGKVLFSSKAYAPTSGFFSAWSQIPATINGTLEVKLASNDSTIVSRSIDFQSANAYQIYLNGYLHGKGSQKIYVNTASYATY